MRRWLICVAFMPGWPCAIAGSPAPLDAAAERYRPELSAAVEQCYVGVRALRARVEAGDLDGARRAWIDARIGWERAEVFTSGFTSELDAEIDSWPSAVNGFHFIEARLFGAQRTDVKPAVDALLLHISDLQLKVRQTALTAQGMLEGSAHLAYELGESKADGGESRFSGTSLEDMRNNAAGLEQAYRLVFEPELQSRAPPLAAILGGQLSRLRQLLGSGALASLDADNLRRTSEDLVLSLQRAAPVLGLQTPQLSELAQQ